MEIKETALNDSKAFLNKLLERAKAFVSQLKQMKMDDFKALGLLTAIMYGVTFIFALLFSTVSKGMFSKAISDSTGMLGMVTDFNSIGSGLFNPIQIINLFMKNPLSVYMSDYGKIAHLTVGVLMLQCVLLLSIWIAQKIYLKLRKLESLSTFECVASSILFSWFHLIMNFFFATNISGFISVMITGGSLYLIFIAPVLIFFMSLLASKVPLKKVDFKQLVNKGLTTFQSHGLISLYLMSLVVASTVRLLPGIIALEVNPLSSVMLFLIALPNIVLSLFFNTLGIPTRLELNNVVSYSYNFWGNATIWGTIYCVVMAATLLMILLNMAIKIYKNETRQFISNYAKRASIIFVILLCLSYITRTSALAYGQVTLFIGEISFSHSSSFLLTFIIGIIWLALVGIATHFKSEWLDSKINQLNLKSHFKILFIVLLLLSILLNLNFSKSETLSIQQPSISNQGVSEQGLNYYAVQNNAHYVIGEHQVLLDVMDGIYHLDLKSSKLERIIEKTLLDEVYVGKSYIYIQTPFNFQIYDFTGKEVTEEPMGITGAYLVSFDEAALYEYGTQRVFNLKGEPLYKMRASYDGLYLVDLKTALFSEGSTLSLYDFEKQSTTVLTETFTGTISQTDKGYMYTFLDDNGLATQKVYGSDYAFTLPTDTISLKVNAWYFDHALNQLVKIDDQLNQTDVFDFGSSYKIEHISSEEDVLILQKNRQFYYFDIDSFILRAIAVEMKGGAQNE